MTPLLRNSLLLALNLSIWSLNGLMVNGTVRLSAKSGIPLLIQSDPERIKLSIDARPWQAADNDGGWLQTPATIYLPEGQHKMLVERPGYGPQQFKVLLAPGDSAVIKPELEKQVETFIETEIVTEGDGFENLTVMVDSGLALGPAPLEIDNLIPGTHFLELRWRGVEGLRKKPYRCVFNAAVVGTNNTLKITIKKSGKKLKVTGCKRI